MNPNSKILISGAGVAGLTSAIWLGRQGFKPTIVERAPDVRADGYIISLSHRSYRFADQLELLPEIRERYAGVTSSSYHRGRNTLLKFDYRSLFEGVDVVQIMRDDLQDILYDHARNLANFRFGTSIESISPGRRRSMVRFSDGREDEYDVIIGADGSHSGVRRLSFASDQVQLRYLGLCAAAYRLPNIAALKQKFETHMERDRYMVIFTTPKDDLAAVFVWATDIGEAPSPATRHGFLQEAYAGTRGIVRDVLDYCPADGGFYIDPLIQVRMNDWYKHHSVLTGDAAHSLTLISGQGATMAFTGACVLADALSTYERAEAFTAYQSNLQRTVFDVQDRTRSIARWYVPCSWWRQSVRDLGMALFPTQIFESHFKSKYTRA
ncbi:MAG: FAD-dependent monooxygenase [Gammaproteobacteria bacterium]